MKNIYLLLLAVIIGFVACTEDDDPKPNPTISFVTDAPYVYQDGAYEAGDTVYTGITAEYNGSDRLVTFNIYYDDQLSQAIEIDNKLEYEIYPYFEKTIASEDKWTFEVVDEGGLSASVSLTLTRKYGDIVTNNSVVLGAQNNSSAGSFYSTSTDQVYLQGDAFNNQGIIDLVYFYDASDANTLASPGANIGDDVFTGASGLANWTTLNESYYYKTALSVSDFDAATTDSVIVWNYDNEESKRKAKNLAIGDVYTFKTEAGKMGMFKVVAVNGEATGDIEIAIKMED